MKSVSQMITDLEESLYEMEFAVVVTFEMKSRYENAKALVDSNRVVMTPEENVYVEKLMALMA